MMMRRSAQRPSAFCALLALPSRDLPNGLTTCCSNLPNGQAPAAFSSIYRITPVLSGPDLQDRLSVLGSHVPIVFLTGHADIRTTIKVMKAGADDLLTKPVTKEELISTIERAIARNCAWQEKTEQLHSLQILVDADSPGTAGL